MFEDTYRPESVHQEVTRDRRAPDEKVSNYFATGCADTVEGVKFG